MVGALGHSDPLRKKPMARRPRCVRRKGATSTIVDAYVSLKDRAALEEMREHRQRLRKSLQEKAGGWVDVSRSIQIFDEDIEAVEAGLARL